MISFLLTPTSTMTTTSSETRLQSLPAFELLRWDEEGERVYGSPLGGLRSVTTILSSTRDNSGIELWRESVGEERADFIRDLAAFRGTQMHLSIERYLQDGEFPSFSFLHTPYWKSIFPFVKTIEAPVLLEGAVWHPDGFAGTLDCVAYLPEDGTQPTLLDWKSANKRCDPVKLYEYGLQVAAYTAAANYVYAQHGLNIQQARIVIAIPDEPYQIESLDADALQQLFKHFQARLQRYTYARGKK